MYVCVVRTIYRQTLYILCVGTGFTVLLCAGAVRRPGTQHVWSASRKYDWRKVENISFKENLCDWLFYKHEKRYTQVNYQI